MPKNFELEIRESYGKKYLKAIIYQIARLEESKILLTSLPSVKSVNISKSEAKKSPSENLTIYNSRLYEIEETKQEVNAALKSYFEGSSFDPTFISNTLSSISEKAYFQVMDYIIQLGKELENYRDLKRLLNEELTRDYFMAFLNTISQSHTATAETFNHNGHTDILLKDSCGNNLFIAECKVWHGKSQITDAVTQLLDRYVGWRDEKVAVIVFNKSVNNFTDVISNANIGIKEHPQFLSFVSNRKPTSFSYIFKHPSDTKKTIKLELILFNFR